MIKFYHNVMIKKKCWKIENNINTPSHYSTIKLVYVNRYEDCPAKNIECKLFMIEDYYKYYYSVQLENYTYST